MRGPHNIFRLVRTVATLERSGAMKQILAAIDIPWPLHILLSILRWPLRWLGDKGDPSLPPLVRGLNALGPAYVKFGQVLSTRPDVVGVDLAQQLRILQDNLPPFSLEEARKVIKAELGDPDTLFSYISEPVAAASIAQVHQARLAGNNTLVAVKILRPGIVKAFRRDIDAFYFAAWMLQILSPTSRRLRPVDVIRHFDHFVAHELDLRLETASAAEFAEYTKGDEGFSIPKPYWNLSSRRVMTLDWVEGIPLGDNAALDAAGHDRTQLGRRVLELFLSHALRDGLFHADMHQGNMKVGPDGDIIAYDFGIMGRIDSFSRRIYAEVLYGFIRRDYRYLADVHFEAGYVPADRDKDEFALALRAVGEPVFGMEATNISMGRLLAHLFEVTEKFGMSTRTELILLQRTMVVVEGVARSLDPHINIWEISRPIVQKYIQENLGPQAFARDLSKTMRILMRFGSHLPQWAEDTLMQHNKATPQIPTKRRLKGNIRLFLEFSVAVFLLSLAGSLFF